MSQHSDAENVVPRYSCGNLDRSQAFQGNLIQLSSFMHFLIEDQASERSGACLVCFCRQRMVPNRICRPSCDPDLYNDGFRISLYLSRRSNRVDDHVVEHSFVPDDQIKFVTGHLVFEEENSRVDRLLSFDRKVANLCSGEFQPLCYDPYTF